MAEITLPAACPACVGHVTADVPDTGIRFSVPSVHCVACISKVERAVSALPGVKSARVNLSLKRLHVDARSSAEMEQRIIATLADIGFDAFALDDEALLAVRDDVGRSLLAKLGVAGFAMMNVMLLSVAVWAGADGTTRDLLHWVSAVIALPTIAYAATPFFTKALRALRKARLNMDVPISLAILLATGLSLFETMMQGEEAYFDAALSLTFFLLAGRYLDHRTRSMARSAAAELAALDMPYAFVRGAAGLTRVRTSDLSKDTVVTVPQGGKVPVDGQTLGDVVEVDNAFLTGETRPLVIHPGGRVYAGAVNLGGAFEMKVTNLGQDTLLSRIRDLVALAEGARTRYTSLADKAAQIYAPSVHLLALAAFVVWLWISGDWRHALNIAISVLIITCPCALGLAVPAVMTAAAGRLYRKGVLVKSATGLERLAETREVVFDKTGTLTTGDPKVVNSPSDEALAIAAGLSALSEHPYAKAITRLASARSITAAPVTDVTTHPGLGTSGTVEGHPVRFGRQDWVDPDAPQHAGQAASSLSLPSGAHEVFLFEDTARNEAKPTIAALHDLGLPVAVLSGDDPQITDRLSADLGADFAMGGLHPDQKLDKIKSLQGPVLMVGDGLNDAAALAGAHVSMSPGSAMDATRLAADFVLMNNRLDVIPQTIRVAKSARARILENFAIAAGYNAIAIPIALLGYASPLLAALAMSLSSICVSLNAARLLREAKS